MSEIYDAWNVVRVILQNKFSFYEIKEIVGLANFDVTTLSHLEQKLKGGSTKGQLITAIDRGYNKLANKKHFISIVVEEVLKRKSEIKDQLEQYLQRIGLGIIDGAVVPINLIDYTELHELPIDSQKDLIKSIQRFRDGDLSGAITSACAAIDTVTTRIFKEKNLGDTTKTSFQEKVKRAIQATDIFTKIEHDLKELEWKDVDIFIKNFEGALNQAAYVMQTLRSKMGDVHGTKSTIKALVFDSLKWSSLILRVLSE